jgi:hypothetical protein
VSCKNGLVCKYLVAYNLFVISLVMIPENHVQL